MKYDFETYHPRWNMEAAKWEEAAGGREDIVPLSVADMELLSPPEIIEELQRTAEFGMWGYTRWGERYGKAVRRWYADRHGWEIQPEWIVQLNGVVQGLYAAVRALSQPGDGVLVLTPVYPPFYRAAEENGRRVIDCPLKLEEGRYSIDFADFEAKAREAKLFILCSPHNPVGRVWKEEELRRLGDICLRHGVLVLSDEIHFDIIMPAYRHVSYPTLGERYAQNCLMFAAASKTFSLAALCVANAVIPNSALRAAFEREVRLSGCYTYSIFGIRALEAGYEKCGAWVDQLCEHIWGNYRYLKDFMAKYFPEVRVTDLEGTYLCWLDLRCFGLSGKELSTVLRQRAGLFLDDGYIFGPAGDGFERVNLACPRSVLEQALARFRETFSDRQRC